MGLGPAILAGRVAALVCVGGPCAGVRIRDTGAERYKVAVPMPLGVIRDRPASEMETTWAEYARAEMAFDGEHVTVLVYRTISSPARLVEELVRGYSRA